MFPLAKHPDSRVVSFQERHSLGGWLKNPDAALGNADYAFCASTRVDAERLGRSLALACGAHDALRTRFALDGEGVLQRYFLPASDQLFELHIINCGASADDPLVGQQMMMFCEDAFRVTSPQWLRVLLMHTADDCSVFMFRMPHLITDAASMTLFTADVWKHYEALSSGEAVTLASPPYSLHDYAASQQEWAASEDFQSQFGKQLEQTVARTRDLLVLAPDAAPRRARPIIPAEAFMPPSVQTRLIELGRKTKINPGTLLSSCAVICIGRIFGQHDICYRLPFSARTSRQVENIVGFLSTDILMFARLDLQQTFMQFAFHMHRESFSMMRYGSLPWSLIRERLRGQLSDAPFNDYIINVLPPRSSFSQRPGFETRPVPFPVFGSANFRLKVLITQGPKGIRICLRLGEEERERALTSLLPQFMSTLCALIESPESTLGEAMQVSPSIEFAN